MNNRIVYSIFMNKFEDMKTFIRIVESGSITLAAEQMNTVKSAISKRLSNLENMLGVTLLNRTTRSQTLTDSGRQYYQKCLKILEDIAEIETSLKNDETSLSGTIKLAVPLSFGLLHLRKALTEFQKKHPKIKFDIDFNDKKVDIINEGFDLAIRIGKLDDSSLKARKITSVRTILTASQDYLAKFGIPKHPKDLLKGYKNLLYKNTPSSLYFKNSENKNVSMNLPTALISNNGDFLCQAALDGLGLLNTPDFICYEFVRNGELIPVLPQYYVPESIGVFAVYPQTRHLQTRVRVLIDYLINHFGDIPYWSIEK